MLDRLKVNNAKVDEMIIAAKHLASQEDPVGVERFSFKHENGMQVYNKTASFGTILIIYESRPDVTVEAAGIAFKSGNKIVLKDFCVIPPEVDMDWSKTTGPLWFTWRFLKINARVTLSDGKGIPNS